MFYYSHECPAKGLYKWDILRRQYVAPVKPIQWSSIVSLTMNLITNTHYRVFCILGHIYNAVLILRTVLQVGMIILSIFKRTLRLREGKSN